MSTLEPSFIGFIGSTKDALMVIQAILDKKLPTVSRRPGNRERNQLIRLGHVFVFIEETSGIKRWTDGVPWSASRILGRFLVYRQLDTTTVRQKNSKRKSSRTLVNPSDEIPGPKPTFQSRNRPEDDQALVKKTLSVSVEDEHSKVQTIHLISYFSAHDVLSGNLIRPSQGGLDQPNILTKLTESVASLTLGGKMPVGDESQYYLDSSYQLLDMLVHSTTSAGMDSLVLDPMGHSSGHMQQLGLDTLNLSLQDAAQSTHYLQLGSGPVLHNVNAVPLQPLLDYPPPHLFQQLHLGLPLQIPPQQDVYKLQMPQPVPHVDPRAQVSYPMHLQVPPNMMADMHPHMQQMFTQHNVDDAHASAYPITQSGSESASIPMNVNTQSANMQQNPQYIPGPTFYPWGMQQPQTGEYFPTEQYPDRESKEYY